MSYSKSLMLYVVFWILYLYIPMVVHDANVLMTTICIQSSWQYYVAKSPKTNHLIVVRDYSFIRENMYIHCSVAQNFYNGIMVCQSHDPTLWIWSDFLRIRCSSCLFGFLCLFSFFGHLSNFGLWFWSVIMVSDFGQRFCAAIFVSDFGQIIRSAISVSDLHLWSLSVISFSNFGQRFWPAILVSDFGQQFWSTISVSYFGQWSPSVISVSNFGPGFGPDFSVLPLIPILFH